MSETSYGVPKDAYIDGLKAEFRTATGEHKKAVKAELDRVAGRTAKTETTVAPKNTETA